MKQLNLSTIISSFILGISIVISGLIISNSEQKEVRINEKHQKEYKPLMTIKETSEYLNLSELQVKTIISSEETMLRASGSYTGMMLPIIRIGTDIYISTDELKEWIKQSTTERKQYQ
ncbi:helix-turn-helix domain-containing protein [Paenibacillus terrigena]|uniref:helix-turn-helix domain-containing protein n=1 Tax=Paenibacillus terrigena TaxID=369333 RepID=UPI0003661714|nr:helix-turn-helix domain-containing protein [Paenibacillus terrigena]